MIRACSVLAVVLLCACPDESPRGSVNQECAPDGTCTGPGLECAPHPTRYVYICQPKGMSHAPAVKVDEAERFCRQCEARCGVGKVRLCAYSDTSVWGAKPATCECKP